MVNALHNLVSVNWGYQHLHSNGTVWFFKKLIHLTSHACITCQGILIRLIARWQIVLAYRHDEKAANQVSDGGVRSHDFHGRLSAYSILSSWRNFVIKLIKEKVKWVQKSMRIRLKFVDLFQLKLSKNFCFHISADPEGTYTNIAKKTRFPETGRFFRFFLLNVYLKKAEDRSLYFGNWLTDGWSVYASLLSHLFHVHIWKATEKRVKPESNISKRLLFSRIWIGKKTFENKEVWTNG